MATIHLMDLTDYQGLDGAALQDYIRSLTRTRLDEEIRRFGAHYALLCQRLEALYTPDRLDRFMAIRPGGLREIDLEIAQAHDRPKELALLQMFRELNRILPPFMDVFEEHFLEDFKHMPKEELERLEVEVKKELNSASKTVGAATGNDRLSQNAAGTLRLATLMHRAIRHELRERFGVEGE